MRLGLLIGAVGLAQAAVAQPAGGFPAGFAIVAPSSVAILNCEGDGPDLIGRFFLVCEAHNPSATAIAELIYGYRLIEPGRTVPWAELGPDGMRYVEAIAGGIEPGETVPVTFGVDRLPERADPTVLEVELTIFEVRDVDGLEIVDRDTPALSVQETNAGALTQGEMDDLRRAIQGCWNVDVGSEASMVAVTVGFEMGQDRHVAGDVRLVSASGGSPAAQEAAFERARRAVLRCQADGYPLPPEKLEAWSKLQLTFDAATMTVR